jgi:hypothetical protein
MLHFHGSYRHRESEKGGGYNNGTIMFVAICVVAALAVALLFKYVPELAGKTYNQADPAIQPAGTLVLYALPRSGSAARPSWCCSGNRFLALSIYLVIPMILRRRSMWHTGTESPPT